MILSRGVLTILAWSLLVLGGGLTATAATRLWRLRSGQTAVPQPRSYLGGNQQVSSDTRGSGSARQPASTSPVLTGQVSGASTSATISTTSNATPGAQTSDVRAELVSNFLRRHGSPLQPHDHYGQVLVEIADRYRLDFRLLPAIAMQESNLCKKTPTGTQNCLGFGIHSQGKLGFTTYEDSFESAAKTLQENYLDIGLNTTEKIMSKYAPNSNGSWARSINQFMAEIKFNDRELGREFRDATHVLEYAPPDDST